MTMKKHSGKLALATMTLRNLSPKELRRAAGNADGPSCEPCTEPSGSHSYTCPCAQ